MSKAHAERTPRAWSGHLSDQQYPQHAADQRSSAKHASKRAESNVFILAGSDCLIRHHPCSNFDHHSTNGHGVLNKSSAEFINISNLFSRTTVDFLK
jgi:hypothetical protein